MNDQFLEELRAEWRGSDIDPGRMIERLERRRRSLRFLLVLEVVGGAVALVVGIWFGWRAIADGNALFALAAAALLSAVALSLLAVRRLPTPPLEEGPFGALQRTRRDLVDLERALTRWRSSAWILLACSLGLWALHVAGHTDLTETALMSMAWVGTAVTVAIWSAWRGRHIQRERAACERLLADYTAPDS